MNGHIHNIEHIAKRIARDSGHLLNTHYFSCTYSFIHLVCVVLSRFNNINGRLASQSQCRFTTRRVHSISCEVFYVIERFILEVYTHSIICKFEMAV